MTGIEDMTIDDLEGLVLERHGRLMTRYSTSVPPRELMQGIVAGFEAMATADRIDAPDAVKRRILVEIYCLMQRFDFVMSVN